MCSVRDRRRRRGHARCAGVARKANRRAELPRPRVAHTSMVGIGRWGKSDRSPCGLRRLCRHGAARDPGGAGARAEVRPARHHSTSRRRQGAHRLPGGLEGDGAGLGDPLHPDRRRQQPPADDAVAAGERQPLRIADRQGQAGRFSHRPRIDQLDLRPVVIVRPPAQALGQDLRAEQGSAAAADRRTGSGGNRLGAASDRLGSGSVRSASAS